MKYLSLQNSNELCMVDDLDYENLLKYKWYIMKNNYVRASFRSLKRKDNRIGIHRYLMNCPDHLVVDHIDGNPLNNQRSNLRLATNSQNICNSKKQKNTLSKYIGVSYSKTENRTKKWRAACEKSNKMIYIGRYQTEIEAALAYNEKVKEIFGEFAKLNIIK